METYGKKVWFIPDAFYNSQWNGQVSHEAVCVINTTDTDANIKFTFFFEDADKLEGFTSFCKAGRTHHIRMDRLRNEKGEGIVKDKPYAIMLESDVPLIAQYSRLDTSQSEMALMTTIPY
ncbi:MAG: hypothetical protein E7491_08360 [Ruminococcaceae bacterium]|nr:hypothetical protein [Oscillospiraceae bacterium]